MTWRRFRVNDLTAVEVKIVDDVLAYKSADIIAPWNAWASCAAGSCMMHGEGLLDLDQAGWRLSKNYEFRDKRPTWKEVEEHIFAWLQSRDDRNTRARIRRVPTATRIAVYERDRYQCRYCGAKDRHVAIDHVMPGSRGGSDDLENLVSACKICNCRKGNKTPEEAGMPLRPVPPPEVVA